MSSKVFMFLGVLLALLLLVSSDGVAKETKLNEAQNTQPEEVKEPAQQYGGGCGRYGCGGGGGGGGGCRYGCCGGWGYNGCRRCCRSAEEAQQAMETQANNQQVDEVKEPDQGGGGRGGYCGRYGCCNWGRYGCQRCCRSAEEALSVDTQANNQQVDEVKEPEQQGGGGGGGGYCGRRGCCGWGYGRCQRCCRANEVVNGNQVDEQGHV